MSARVVRRAAWAAILAVGAATAGEAEIRLERRPDGTLLMANSSAPRGVAATSIPRAEIDDLIEAHARRQSLDPQLVRAVVDVESSFDPSARSRKGAMGLMQLMPATARSLEVDDPYDPEENLRGGTTYLRRLLDRFGGDLEMALAGYNAGPEAVERYRGTPPYPETHEYVNRVLRRVGGEAAAPAVGVRRGRPGRPVYLRRDAGGRLVLTTAPRAGS